MALNVNITKNGISYDLKCTDISHDFGRSPVQIGLPAFSATALPQVFSLDLGVCTEQISLVGVIEEPNSSYVNSSSPTKYTLEGVARTWWNYGSSAEDLALLKIGDMSYYYGHIKQLGFKMEGGIEDRWSFSLIFLVRKKANIITPKVGLSASMSYVYTNV